MADIWSHSPNVTTMHPIGGFEIGWDDVGGSWAQVAQLASGGQVKLNQQRIQVSGDMAFEIGVEQGEATFGGEQVPIEHRVANAYRREEGAWKIVHHHTDISLEMVGLINRLQGAQ